MKKIIVQNELKQWISRPMTFNDVKSYFKKISSKNVWTGEYKEVNGKLKKEYITVAKTPGEYCERCGINIGKDFLYKEGKPYKKHYICPSCYEDKKNGRENVPDLEDKQMAY